MTGLDCSAKQALSIDDLCLQMVVFSCDACGESLRKKDVLKHYQFNCRRCESLTCVDCKKQFWGDEYAAHTQCITDEDFKYGLVGEHKCDKGEDLCRALAYGSNVGFEI